jgi:DNA processing protein
MTEQTRFWLALSLLPGVGPARLSRVRRHYPDPVRLLDEPPGLLVELGLPADLSARLPWAEADREVELAARAGVRLLSPADEGFPPALAGQDEGPVLLYLRGRLGWPDEPAVAIVGTRRATAIGLETARRLAAELAAAGVAIVSGLARGIDTAAHKGALESGGRTIAVLGGGLGRPYPPENRPLAAEIATHGAVLTEYAMQSEPVLGAFLRRNRWIAAMSQATVIVEAPVGSGALRTARHARELGREVLAAPGPMYGVSWAGSNRLLRDGAAVIAEAADVLRRLGLSAAGRALETARPAPLWPEPQQRVLDCLEPLPMALDDVIGRSGLDAAQVRAALVALELAGAVRRHPGPLYGLP